MVRVRRPRIKRITGRRLRTARGARRAVDRRQDKSIFKLYKMVKYGKEKKYVDQQLTTSVGQSWSNILTRDLTYIPEGTTDNTRIGNKIKIYRHQIKVVVTAGDVTNLYRIMLVRFGAIPTASLGIQQVLENSTATSPFQLMSFKKRNAECKFSILWDSGVRKLAGNGSADTSPYGPASQRTHNIVIRSRNGLFTQYSGAAANTVTNGFTYLVAVSDSAVIPHVGFQSIARTIFSG